MRTRPVDCPPCWEAVPNRGELAAGLCTKTAGHAGRQCPSVASLQQACTPGLHAVLRGSGQPHGSKEIWQGPMFVPMTGWDPLASGAGRTDGGDGDVPHADAHHAVDVLDGGPHRRQVQQRLTHAHEHCAPQV